jgi:hypothetical protein
MKTNILNCVTRTFHKAGFQLKKHSPEILIVAGVAGTVTSAVMACRATTKLSGILEESKAQIDQIHNYIETEGYSEKYTEEDGKKDLAITYIQTGAKVVKLYAPSVILGALSLTAILTSNNILRQRNIAIAAAYTAVDKNFKKYRERVVERFGSELDKELRYNIKAKEIEETITNEDGTETTVKKVVNTVEPDNIHSMYAKFFDECSPYWNKDADMNLMFLKQQQNYANEKLKTTGYLFLNDAYDMLGIPRTRAGQQVGWYYDEKKPVGDNYVDFGIYDIYSESNRLFVNGYERSILLDFNVDSNLLNYLEN